ncbi:conserved hypothetical protein [Neospora caninum Liverpool]|uniref:Uncharacterized protein n=1 Tax=Neospora caninum (strain Liverpool) TaxID=572307 RepID=F0VN26_NEOCL|nr:conserved hypothetical protein [Neospora caninum Liverpool]CBZ55122.1 conserved hypothetical protein [Neospora caninum Liverpool]CEL69848.1 TPA: hypothetical protein BN1204_055470 [Neospora caninum Liverpool]|eukprot:XP_003885150.1 conserved hypothetical protein [Neospora caninum Liverpool]
MQPGTPGPASNPEGSDSSSADPSLLSSFMGGYPQTPDQNTRAADMEGASQVEPSRTVGDATSPKEPAAKNCSSAPAETNPEFKLEVRAYCLEGKDGPRPKTPEAKNDLTIDACSTAHSSSGLKASISSDSCLTGRTEACTPEPSEQNLKRETRDAGSSPAENAEQPPLGSHTDCTSQDRALPCAPESEIVDSSATVTSDAGPAKLCAGSPTPSRPETTGTAEMSSSDNLGNSLSSPDSAACQLDGEGTKSAYQQNLVDVFMQFMKQYQEPAPGEDVQHEGGSLQGVSAADVSAARLWLSAVQREADGGAGWHGSPEALSLLSAAAEGLGASAKGKESEAQASLSRREPSRSRGLGAARSLQCRDSEESWSLSPRRVMGAASELSSGVVAGRVSDRGTGGDVRDFRRGDGGRDGHSGSERQGDEECAGAWTGKGVEAAREWETGVDARGRETSDLDVRALIDYLLRPGALGMDHRESFSRRHELDLAGARNGPQSSRSLRGGAFEGMNYEKESTQDALLSALISRFPNLQHQRLTKDEAREDEDSAQSPAAYRDHVSLPKRVHMRGNFPPDRNMRNSRDPEETESPYQRRRSSMQQTSGKGRCGGIEGNSSGRGAKSMWLGAESDDRGDDRSSGDDRQANKKRGRGPVADEDVEDSALGDEGDDVVKRIRSLGRGKKPGASPPGRADTRSPRAEVSKAGRNRARGAAGRGAGAAGRRNNDDEGSEFLGSEVPGDEASCSGLLLGKREDGHRLPQPDASAASSSRDMEPGSAKRERGPSRGAGNKIGQAGSHDRVDREEPSGAGAEDLEFLDPEGEDEGAANTLITGEDESLSEQQVALLKHIYEVLSKAEEYFSFKSALYQLHIKRHLKSCVCSPSGNNAQNSTKAIRLFPFMPAVPINGVEQRALLGVRKRLEAGGSSVLVPGGPGQQILEEMDELLTSLINKLLLIIVVKYQTCFIHAPARAQLREFLVSFVFPGDPATQMLFRDHVQAVVHARIRHFRDSVGRTLRQNQPTSRRRCFAGESGPGQADGWGAGDAGAELGVSGRSAVATAFSNKSASPESPRRGVSPALAARASGCANRDRREEEESGNRREFGASTAEFLPTATAQTAASNPGRSRPSGTAPESFTRRAGADTKKGQRGGLLDAVGGGQHIRRLENPFSPVPSEDEHLWNAGEFSDRRLAVETRRNGLMAGNSGAVRRGRRNGDSSLVDDHDWTGTQGKSREQLLEQLQQTLLIATGNGRDEGLASLSWDAQDQLEQLLQSAATNAPALAGLAGQQDGTGPWRGTACSPSFDEEGGQTAARSRGRQNNRDEWNAFKDLGENEELRHIYGASSRTKTGSVHSVNNSRHASHSFAGDRVGAQDTGHDVAASRKDRLRDAGEESTLAARSVRGCSKI